MLKFGVDNVRRLEHVDPIEIKPITLLLGRNSGGKSTFLRTFPLFRQSLMTRTSSPILWYGDLVDFGSFDTVLARDVRSKSVYFSYVIDVVRLSFDGHIFLGDEFGSYEKMGHDKLEDVTYKVGIERHGERNRISSININIVNPKINVFIEIDENNTIKKFRINNDDLLSAVNSIQFILSTGSLFPDLRYIRQRDRQSKNFWIPDSGTAVLPALLKLLNQKLEKRISEKRIEEIAIRLITSGFSDAEKFVSIGKSFGITVGRQFGVLVSDPNDETYRQIALLVNAAALPSVFRSIAQHLRAVLSATLYIGPARARSERYYRYQDLAISEIDPDGKNFPMFLNSLNKIQIQEFSQWVQSLFGYGVKVSQQTGHISINLTDGGTETNIVDVGYGVSQILPVLGQIWWARNRPVPKQLRIPLSLLAIEQPELHLHPAHQALLADALVGETVASSLNKPKAVKMHYIIETHSETLVNRLGELIAAKRLDPQDVQVILFEPVHGTGKTSVRAVEYDNDGILIDWPYGFFQPAVL